MTLKEIQEEIAKNRDIPVSHIERICPLSSMQRDIYMDLMIEPESVIYNLGLSIDMGTETDKALWEKAVSIVCRKESVTRTGFYVYENEPFQFIDREAPVHFEFIDLTDTDTDTETLITEKITRTYDLNDHQLFNNILVKARDGHYIAVLAVLSVISDIYSGKLYFERVRSVYEALLKGSAVDARDALCFYDYVEDSQGAFDSQDIREYWEKVLYEVEHIGSHTGLTQDGQNRSHTITMGPAQSEEIKAYCRAKGWSLPAYFRAVYGILLNGYFDPLEDFVVHDIIGGRPEAYKNTLGCFYQVVPMVFPKKLFGYNGTISDYLDYIKDYRKKLGPLQNISVFSQKKILDGKSGFFYNYINFPCDIDICGEKSVMRVHDFFPHDQVHFVINDEDDHLVLTIHYNETFFSDGSNFLDRVLCLSRQITQGFEYLHDLSILLDAERHKLLYEWNDTARPYPDDKCIHQLFEEQVERSPDAIAVVFEDQHLTYGELNARSNQLARHLQGMGVGPEVLTGICVERSVEMVAGILGILKAGGAYVPLDPAYPIDRLAFMLSDSHAPVLLTQERLLGALPEHDARVVCLDSDWEVISQEMEDNPVSDVSAGNLAYVIYTSGSTGRPKGVLIIHQGVCNLASAEIQIYGVRLDSYVFQFASYSFDTSVSEIFMAFCSGAKLCMGKREFLMQLLPQYAITHVTLPPSTLLSIHVREKLSVLQTLIVAGETCTPDLAVQWSAGRRFFNAYGPTESTVCSAIAKYNEDQKLSIGCTIGNKEIYILAQYFRTTPIGFPGELHIGGVGLARGYLNRPHLTAEKFIPNPFSHTPGTRLYKTGDLAQYLPDGNIEFLGRIDNQVKIRGFRIELGEIEAVLSQHPNIREAVVMVRESRNGDKQLAAYVVSDLIPERLPYRVGCTVELEGNTVTLETENISSGGVCLARAPDDFVEGKNLRLCMPLPGKPEESLLTGTIKWCQRDRIGIEFDLPPAQLDMVRKSVEYLLETNDLTKILQRTISGNLINHLKEKLPSYMIPSGFVFLQSFPLTPNGKVDRRALSHMDPSVRAQEEYIAPRTHTEKTLAHIWHEILGVEKVGIHDHFFKLGGHSLLAIQMTSRVREAFETELLLKTIFKYPTLGSLAERIDISRWITQSPESSCDEEDVFEEIVL